MYHSVILNKLINIINLFKHYSKSSTQIKTFNHIDNFFINTTLNSNLIRLFTQKHNNKIFLHSKLFRLISKIGRLLFKRKITLNKWITSSITINLLKNTVDFTIRFPFKFVGLFCSIFLIVNITYSAIIGSDTFIIMLLKLIILAVFIGITNINISLRDIIEQSKSYKLLKWIISFEN